MSGTKHSLPGGVPTWVSNGVTYVAYPTAAPPFPPNTLYDAKGDVLVATANDTPARLAVGADNTVLTADSGATAGVAWKTPHGATARTNRTAGVVVLNSVTWADVDNALDLVIAAVVGDWVEVGLSATMGTQAVIGLLDAVSVVAGAPVNNWSQAGAESATGIGVAAWEGFSGVSSNQAGSIVKQMVAGDLSGGNVTIRLRYRTATAAAKNLVATIDQPLTFWAHNLKQ